MNLEVLQSSKASSTSLLITLEWSLPGVNSDVGHQLVLSIEWFTLSWTVLQNIVLKIQEIIRDQFTFQKQGYSSLPRRT